MCKAGIPNTSTAPAEQATAVVAENTNAATTAAALPKILTRKQVLEQSDPETNLLVIIHGKVYDVTKWQYQHPGGHLTIRALCGKDATEPFFAMHDPKAIIKWLSPRMQVATVLEGDEVDTMTTAFRKLTDKLHKEGTFQTNYSYYYFLCARIFAMFGLVIYGVMNSEELYVHCLCGVLLGLVWQQAAFIGHDLGHNGITHNRILDSALGLFFGNFFTGFSIGWWKRSHNVHHIVTNSIEHDPDIQHLPIFAISKKFLEDKIFSTWFNDYLALNKAAHVLIKYQHWLYYPVMAFARFNLYVQSLLHACGVGVYSTPEYMWQRQWQIWTLVGFHVWMYALTMQLPTVLSRVLFYVLAHNVAGILHVQITLSHFSMPTYEGVTYDDSSNGYVRTQLLTSLDIDCPKWMDWLHGGLQFQTVHHIWPRIPRHNLRRVQGILIDFCKEHDLKYNHMGFLAANRSVLGRLKETSKATKSFNELFSDSFNLIG